MYINDIGAWFQGAIPTIIILGFVGSILAALIVKFVREARDMRRHAASFAEAEKRFRDAERQLDELLRRDEAVIAASGITIRVRRDSKLDSVLR